MAVLGSGQIRVMVGSAGLGRGVRSISVSGRSELHAVLLTGALRVPSWRSPGINDVTARSGLSVRSVYTQGCLGQRFAVPGLSRQSWWAGAHCVLAMVPWCRHLVGCSSSGACGGRGRNLLLPRPDLAVGRGLRLGGSRPALVSIALGCWPHRRGSAGVLAGILVDSARASGVLASWWEALLPGGAITQS